MPAVDRFPSHTVNHAVNHAVNHTVKSVPPGVRMFDANCANIYRVPLNTVANRSSDLSHTSVQSRLGNPSILLHNPITPVSVHAVSVVGIGAEPTSDVRASRLLRWGTMLLLYLTAMATGLSMLGMFGGAVSMDRTLLSIALFHSVLLPVLGVHCILSIDNKYAVVSGLVSLVCTSVSVPFSLALRTQLFASISFALLILFHIVAGVHGWRWVLHLPIMGIFVWFCVGGFPINPDRGDTMGLIVIAATQIVLVCISGVISTIWRCTDTV